jgi:hypothetical protein
MTMTTTDISSIMSLGEPGLVPAAKEKRKTRSGCGSDEIGGRL